MCLSSFVSTLGSHEMRSHELPIITIIIIIVIIIIIIMCFRHGSIPSVLLNEDKIARVDLWVTN